MLGMAQRYRVLVYLSHPMTQGESRASHSVDETDLQISNFSNPNI